MSVDAFELKGYSGSRDYARLAALAQEQSVICLVDGAHRRMLAQTSFMSKPGQDYWSIAAPGRGYVQAFSSVEFEKLCAHLNVEFLEPAHSPG